MCLEMNHSSQGYWGVGTNLGTIIFHHLKDETPERYNGSQFALRLAFSGNGKKMLVNGMNEIMQFDF
jgi:hypothetical protein